MPYTPSNNLGTLPTLTNNNPHRVLAEHYGQKLGGQANANTPATPPTTPTNNAGITWNQNNNRVVPYGWNYAPSQYQTGPDAGRLFNPKPPQWVTDASQYQTWQAPGIKSQNGNYIQYTDGSFVDLSSNMYKQASQIMFPNEDWNAAWRAIPASWQADLAGWEPTLRERWIQAFSEGNRQAAEEIKKQAYQARTQSTNYAQQQKQQQPAQTPTRVTAYMPR